MKKNKPPKMPVVPGVVHFSDAGSIPAVSTKALVKYILSKSFLHPIFRMLTRDAYFTTLSFDKSAEDSPLACTS